MSEAKDPVTVSVGEVLGAQSEDVLGLSPLSFWTLWQLIIRPNQVFRVYAQGRLGPYAPAIRMWFGLLTLAVFVSYFFGGYEAILRGIMEQAPGQMEALSETLDGRVDEYISISAEVWSLTQAPAVGLMTALGVFLLKPMSRGLGFAARFNITFSILSVGSLLGIIAQHSGITDLIGPMAPSVVVGVAYFITMVRGAPDVLATTRTGAVTKSLVFSTIIMVLVLIAGGLMGILAGIIAAFRLG